MINIAINGYGRIGRNVMRALYEGEHRKNFKVVAINDLGDAPTNAHLTRYDTAHGPFSKTVEVSGNDLVIDGDIIKVFAERSPENLPWGDLGVDIVFECTGFFTTAAKAGSHLKAGAKKVLISAPGGKDVDATIVYGVNDKVLKPEHKIVSNASCTTNCLAPLAQALHQNFTIEKGLLTTIHAYTNDQVLTDVFHTDLRRARSATSSMIPAKTGAAAAVGLVVPELNGKLDGFAIRVPVINVSFVDLCISVTKTTSKDEVNACLKEAADGKVLYYNDEPLVSIDFNHNPASSIFDSTTTMVIGGNFIKACAWYDNEWGFSNRMLDVAKAMAELG